MSKLSRSRCLRRGLLRHAPGCQTTQSRFLATSDVATDRDYRKEVEGKKALIFGGVQGIGLAYTQELLKHGAKKIIVIDNQPSLFAEVSAKLSKQYGEGRVSYVACDIEDLEKLIKTFQKTFCQLDGADILLNNAGICDDNIWEKEINVNLKSTMMSTYMGLENMKRGSAIINTVSIAALSPYDLFPAYTASKYGVLGFSLSFGTPKMFKLYGIRVMSLCPNKTKKLKRTIAKQVEKRPYTQDPSRVAATMVYMLKHAVSGSVYLSSESKAYEIALPSIESLIKKRVL